MEKRQQYGTAIVEGFPIVCNSKANQVFGELFELAYKTLEGRDTWYRLGDNSHEFWQDWKFSHSNTLQLWNIKS